MKSIVPFISTLPKADIDQWLKILKKKLPKERIVKFSSLKKSDYKKIKSTSNRWNNSGN